MLTLKSREAQFLKVLLDQLLDFQPTTSTTMLLRSLRSSLTALYVEIDRNEESKRRVAEAFDKVKAEW